jgi:transcriptional regulator with XRE-family HTH domain
MLFDVTLWDTPRGRELLMTHDVGGAVRLARQHKGWRQADLAAASGYSISTISRLETGRRDANDLGLVRRVAEAVGLSATELGVLIDVLPGLTATVTTDAVPEAEEAAMRRRELLANAGIAIPAAGLGKVINDALAILPAADAETAAVVGAGLVRARAMFDAGSTLRVIHGLPGSLSTAHAAASSHKNPESYVLLAAWYDLATDALIKVGDIHAARITADRSTAYSELSGSAAAMAYSGRSLSIVLRHQDRRQLAEQVALAAAAQVERTGLSSPLEAVAYAHVLCTTAYSAASAGDRDQALGMIGEAARAVGRVGSQPVGHATPVDAAQVALYLVGVHWALGETGAALQAASRLHPRQFQTRERRARLHTDLARTWWQAGDPGHTAVELLAAHQQSSAEVLCRPSIRKMADDILTHHPHARGATGLADILGAHS